ncbi:MAG: hypothetical protein IPK75_18230 [Acidobacteria bacterium]|nr:hypothetical protein [Acidobacteriota bacterium]
MNPREIAIIRELLALRRAGQLAGVWCDAGHLRVELPDGHVYAARKPERYQRVLFAAQQHLATRKVAA